MWQIHSHSPTMFITRNTRLLLRFIHNNMPIKLLSFINTHFTTTRTHLQSSSRGNGCPADSYILPQQKHATIREYTSTPSITHSGDFTHWTLNFCIGGQSAPAPGGSFTGKERHTTLLANTQYKGNDNRRTKLIIISRSVRPVESVSHRVSWTT